MTNNLCFLKLKIYVFSYSDAAGRNRLSSQTFKILNLGLLLGALQTLSSTLPILSAISRSKNNLKTVFGLLCLTHAWLTTRITYYSLSTFGLPTTQFNVKLNAPLSLSYQVSLKVYVSTCVCTCTFPCFFILFSIILLVSDSFIMIVLAHVDCLRMKS